MLSRAQYFIIYIRSRYIYPYFARSRKGINDFRAVAGKMKRRFALLCSTLILALSLGALLCACNGRKGDDLTLTTGNRPDYGSLLSDDEASAVNSALADGATEEQKKSAVMALLNVANRSRLDTHTSLMLQSSDAGISMGDVIMHGFNLKSGDKWYYQLAVEASSTIAAFDLIIGDIAGLLKIAYTKGDGNFYYTVVNGSAPECDCTVKTFPYATFVVTKEPTLYTEEQFKTELHYLNGMHEINNMKFVEEIIADGASIVYDTQNRCYKVEFSIDTEADPDLLAEWFALPKEDMAVGGQTLERYKSYRAELEVWDNGYAKSFKSWSDREAGMGSGKPIDGFEYIWNENEILTLLKEDESIDDEMHKMMHSIDDYIEYYSEPELTAERLSGLKIAGIVIGSVLGGAVVAIIIAVIVVETLLKQGKLPKLQAKREAKKQKRLQKKANKAQASGKTAVDESELSEDIAPEEVREGGDVADNDVENSDEPTVDVADNEGGTVDDKDEIVGDGENSVNPDGIAGGEDVNAVEPEAEDDVADVDGEIADSPEDEIHAESANEADVEISDDQSQD